MKTSMPDDKFTALWRDKQKTLGAVSAACGMGTEWCKGRASLLGLGPRPKYRPLKLANFGNGTPQGDDLSRIHADRLAYPRNSALPGGCDLSAQVLGIAPYGGGLGSTSFMGHRI